MECVNDAEYEEAMQAFSEGCKNYDREYPS